ncbi:acyl-CoA dehydrogenase family protein [Catenulispora rubra]|uniref:acyl-CoA dehydrogenase family protein n=1 Tax=Catenulispora rubra TaxID=280293 RepID=UPI001892358B|nr:acyl-CoA dehydrogenase [Catenulispora rubra]
MSAVGILTPTLLEFREVCRALAGDLRREALALDADPLDRDRLRKCDALELLREMSLPAAYRTRDVPACADEFTGSALGRVVANIELAAGGDVGMVNACATPSLAGLAVDALGDDPQKDLFYRDLAEHRSWTFFGMTEPDHGSDATAMETRLDPDPDGDGLRLNGAKRYVANAERGAIGVVFARTGRTPLSIRAVLLRRPSPGFTGTPLEMTGLRGACIGHMEFDDTPIAREMLLGRHLPASRRGMWGAIRAFNVIRLQIAAQALGAAFAIRDYVCVQRPGWSGHELMSARLEAARALLHRYAIEVDLSPDDRLAPSIAKLHTTELAQEANRWAEAALGPGSLLDHPLLEKWCRDVCAFEFMDGTSNILRLTIASDAEPTRARS